MEGEDFILKKIFNLAVLAVYVLTEWSYKRFSLGWAVAISRTTAK